MQSGHEQLGAWIRRMRLNQREAADMLGVGPVFVSQILARIRTPSLANAVAFERVTGIPAESWVLTDVSDDDAVGVGRSRKIKIAKR